MTLHVRLPVLVGPTASGKTRLGVEVARRLGAEIVSADSRQVYRGLDIGSGKDLDEYRAVTPPVAYHLIDVADPAEVYSVFHFQRDCYRLLARGGPPLLMVGGTGLWVEAVLRGFRIPNVPEDEALRQRLMQQDHDELTRELCELDDSLYRRTDCSTKKRVVRAIEIARYAQQRPVEYSPEPPVTIEPAVFALDVAPDELGRRIDRRLEARLHGGMIDEVRGLLDAGLAPARMAQLGLEYREISAFLLGKKTEQAMTHDLRRGIRQFAKRQRTWFRGLERRGIAVRWIGASEADAIVNHAWG